MEQNKRSSRLQKTVLTASLVLLTGCGCFPKPPNIRARQILQRLNICKVYKAKFGKTLVWKFEKNIEIEDCLKDGYFVLTDTELVDIRRTYNEARDCYDSRKKTTCKVKAADGN